jgi:hypothetical protein
MIFIVALLLAAIVATRTPLAFYLTRFFADGSEVTAFSRCPAC